MYNNFISLYDINKRKNIKNDDSIIVNKNFVVEAFNDFLNENYYKFNMLLQLMESNAAIYEQYARNINEIFKEANSKNINTSIYENRILNNIVYKCTKKLDESIINLNTEFTNKILNESYKNQTADRILYNYDKLSKYCQGFILTESRDLNTITLEYVSRLNESTIDNRKQYFIAMEDLSYRLDMARYQYDKQELVSEISYLYKLKGLSDYEYYNVNELLGVTESEDFADSNDVKKLINKYNSQTNKDVSGIKRIIEKVYGKDPKEVIDDTPSIFKLIRSCIVIGSFALSPLTGLISLMADLWISMSVSRSQCDRMYKIFKKEKDRVDEKSFYSDSKKFISYSKSLDQAMYKIEEHRKKLYTDDEIERQDSLYESNQGMLLQDFMINKIYIQRDYIKKYKSVEELCNKASLQSTPASLDLIDVFGNSSESNIGYFVDDTSSRLRLPLINIRLYDEINEDADITLISSICKELSDDESTITYTMCGDEISKLFKVDYIYNTKILFTSDDEENNIKDKIHVSDMNDIMKITDMANLIDNEILLNINTIIEENFSKLINESIDASSYISNGLYNVVGENYKILIDNKINNNPDTFIKSQLQWSIGILEDNSTDYKLNTVNNLALQIEAADILTNYLTEKVNLANLKMAGLNLTAKAKELSQKEKEASNKFNIVFSKFQKDIERSLTTDKRESIIKGSVIPSASKCLKTAIVTGGAFLVNPALAVIGALGALAISKSLTQKERRLLMDEIEIELKFVEKELSNAESEGNNKKYKQLLMYQKRLQREMQRIHYNIKVTGGRVYETGKKED